MLFLLLITSYNVKMEKFYVLKNKVLHDIKYSIFDKQESLDDIQHLIVKKVGKNGVCVINSFTNECLLMCRDLWKQNKFPTKVITMLKKNEQPLINDELEDRLRDELDKSITFILALSYKCNLKCIYCYQQWNEKLNKELITEDNFNMILDTILEYHRNNPQKYIRLGLFGGEPLLEENREKILKLFEFAAKYGFPMHITTNGVNLHSYLKEIVIYRGLNMTVHTTVDSIISNESTRAFLENDNRVNNKSYKILECVRFLINNNVHVVIESNIDKHNITQIGSMIEFYKNNGFLQNPKFHLGIGRVDDRLFETNYPDIIKDVDILKEMMKLSYIPKNLYVAFIKAPYELCKKLGISFNQHELKNPSNYCWASAPIDNVFYVDADLDTYRCTYTVGRKELALFKFTTENINGYKLPNRTFRAYEKCASCNIGGYCAGGCRLSAKTNFEKQCFQEKTNFERFLKEIFLPQMELLWKKCDKE